VHVERLETRADTFLERYPLPKRMRHDENIGEEDRCVETKATDRLQRHLRDSMGNSSADRAWVVHAVRIIEADSTGQSTRTLCALFVNH
jgi:hypothetical protein